MRPPCDVCGGPIPRGPGWRKRCSQECRRAHTIAYQRRVYAANPERGIAYVEAYKERHPERYRDQLARRAPRSYQRARELNLLTLYRLTLDQYDTMFAEQDGRCAICRRPEARRNKYGISPLSVDHDHATGQVRGLLCARCNAVLGFFEDPEMFAAATDYLRRHSPQEKEADA